MHDHARRLTAAALALLACAWAREARADAYHYTNILVGDRAAGMAGASAGIAAGRASLGEIIATTKALDAEIPLAFGKSRDSYLAAIEAKRPEIEKVFQTTLNVGFSQMYITVAVASVLGALLLAFYRKRGIAGAAGKSVAAAA